MKSLEQSLHWMAAALLIGTLGVSLSVRAEPEETPVMRESSDAYVTLVQADQARDQQDWRNALASYRDAMDRYRRVAETYPDYEPDIVQYRMTYCANQIEAITRKTGRSEEEWKSSSETEPAPKEGDPEGYRERYFALLRESQYLRQRLGELEAAAQGTEGMDVTNQVRLLTEENRKLLDEMEALQSATNQPAAAGAAPLQALREENQQLKTQLDEARKSIEANRRENAQPAGTPPPAQPPAGEAKPAAAQELSSEVLSLMRSALAQERQGNLTAALALYDRTLEARPSYPEALRGKTRCLLGLGRGTEALPVIRSAASEEPGSLEGQMLLGIALGMNRQYDKAVDLLGEVVRKDPSSATAHNALGAAQMAVGSMKQAKAELEKALDLDPSLADAHFNLAEVLCVGAPADREAARAHYRRAVELGVPADAELEQALVAP